MTYAHTPPLPSSSQLTHTHTYKHSYPTCLTQVVQALLIDREEANGGPILRTHVGDGGPVSNGQCCYPWTKELHKLAHHADLTQVLSKRMTTAIQTCPLLMMTQVLRKRVTTATQTCPPHMMNVLSKRMTTAMQTCPSPMTNVLSKKMKTAS